MQCTFVCPIVNVVPGFASHVMFGFSSELSVAFGYLHETTAVAFPGFVILVWFGGQNSNRGYSLSENYTIIKFSLILDIEMLHWLTLSS